MEQLQPKLERALHGGDFANVRDQLNNLPPSKVANIIGHAAVAEQPILFRCLPRSLATTAFEYLPREQQEALLKSMATEEVAEILNHMADDDRTMLFEELPATATKQLMDLLSDEERRIAVKLLGYPERSVGRLMTPHYIAVHPNWSVQQVLDHVRAHGKDSETLTMVYVINEQGLLNLNGQIETVGSITLSGGYIATGSGRLGINGDIHVLATTNTATIAGAILFGNGLRTITLEPSGIYPNLLIPATVADAGGGVQVVIGATSGYFQMLSLQGSNSFTGPLIINSTFISAETPWALGATSAGTCSPTRCR